jgi:hypothetical protein
MFLDICRAALILSAVLFAFGEVLRVSVLSCFAASLCMVSMIGLLVASVL